MRITTIYECERPGCKFSTKNRTEMTLHEANHLGISSPEVYRQYLDLQQQVRSASHALMFTKNEETDAAFDNAINVLIAFEKQHNIKKEGAV